MLSTGRLPVWDSELHAYLEIANQEVSAIVEILRSALCPLLPAHGTPHRPHQGIARCRRAAASRNPSGGLGSFLGNAPKQLLFTPFPG
jgi:hypothetical protein